MHKYIALTLTALAVLGLALSGELVSGRPAELPAPGAPPSAREAQPERALQAPAGVLAGSRSREATPTRDRVELVESHAALSDSPTAEAGSPPNIEVLRAEVGQRLESYLEPGAVCPVSFLMALKRAKLSHQSLSTEHLGQLYTEFHDLEQRMYQDILVLQQPAGPQAAEGEAFLHDPHFVAATEQRWEQFVRDAERLTLAYRD